MKKCRQTLIWYAFEANCLQEDATFKDQEISVLFPRADGIEEGAPVIWKGVSIGNVSDLVSSEKGVEVRLSIKPEYRKFLVSASAFLLKKEGNKTSLEYYVFDIHSPPLKRGERLQGAISSAGLFLLRMRYSASEGLKELQDYMEQSKKEWDAFKESKEAQDLIESIEKNLDEAFKKGSETFEKEIAPAIQEKMDALLRIFREDDDFDFYAK